ncbi:hypothetical protein BDQ94DRAFT_143033 [Aspergillus welwitschiae]|uniref:Uncharacterized protein n=1 Tax=Aspergillus welwitschiae TaxID=1341132 RepID=A0A3F3Q445_9EURO|nr:hypothetical protein BDQ94DRAFT_143033 [Aspergillus welwitschiae]RDH33984.1 hypothetical protein BDQ94DRAFT_143033 [Aspergillus welwitschiae]
MRGTTVLKAQPPYDNTLLVGLSAEVWSYRVIGHSWHNDLMVNMADRGRPNAES